MDHHTHGTHQEGIVSVLDTDLYKLTMQCAVLRSYPDVDCEYAFTNRTPDLKLTRAGFEWLKKQVAKLQDLRLSEDEERFLRETCPYLPAAYISYLSAFAFKPKEQVELGFIPCVNEAVRGGESEDLAEELGGLRIRIHGKWVETILYEIPLLVLISECYFRFSDTDWTYDNQEPKAYQKAVTLLSAGCLFSEFGTRRRRSYHTQELVLKGLVRAASDSPSSPGKLQGTSNVHFAHRFGLNPIGTVAHEWFMGIAAVTQDYTGANEIALRDWIACFGPDTLSIALTDTFGTEQFLKCFARPCALVRPPRVYAELFAGVRQDSGSPEDFIDLMHSFYTSLQIGPSEKTIVFSDSLDVDRCLKLKDIAEKRGFKVAFGVGTFLTNDFAHASDGGKSAPMNIVIKISSANGSPAVKISDNVGKNTGEAEEVRRVKRLLGYEEKEWDEGDERDRWAGVVRG